MIPFGLQVKAFNTLKHFPIHLELFDIEKEKERDNKVFGIIKTKINSKKNKKDNEKKNKTSKKK